jgi:anti-anti-sigma regulatory factor
MTTRFADRSVVRVTESVLTESSLRHAIGLLDEPMRHPVQLDLAGVDIPTAGGLGGLVSLHHALRRRGGKLVLRNVRPWAYEVFSVTALTTVFDVRPA